MRSTVRSCSGIWPGIVACAMPRSSTNRTGHDTCFKVTLHGGFIIGGRVATPHARPTLSFLPSRLYQDAEGPPREVPAPATSSFPPSTWRSWRRKWRSSDKGSRHPDDEMGRERRPWTAAATPAKFQRTKGKGRPGKGGQTTGATHAGQVCLAARHVPTATGSGQELDGVRGDGPIDYQETAAGHHGGGLAKSQGREVARAHYAKLCWGLSGWSWRPGSSERRRNSLPWTRR